jgi:RNA-directed DNA polymerase
VRAVRDQLQPSGRQDAPSPGFVFRTDVKSYYASIDHDILLEQLRRLIPDARVLGLVEQYVRHTVYDGHYETVTQGICLGCSLSPLMGAVYLQPVDDAMAKTGLFYARFMDDWVVLAPTHWKLRAAIRLVNQALAALKVQQHPDKTFVGRVSRGFDFLGYTFSTVGLTGIARKTVAGCVDRMSQLYERGADAIRIGQYVRRWLRWASSGLAGESAAAGGAACDELSVLVCSAIDAVRRHPPHHSPLLTSTTR